MTEELLDIVDENNNPTGESVVRSRVHAEGLWHRTVHVYLFRNQNDTLEFLVHLRSPHKDLKPNRWDTRFGGHLQAGTNLEKAVEMEMKEELGLEVRASRLLLGPLHRSDNFPNREFAQVYYLEYPGQIEDLQFNDGEVQKVEWMSMANIKQSMMENLEKWAGSPEGFAEVSDYLQEKIVSQ
ncbi:NUDIX domain-containing protein [Patescibacteria group bacterium]|nr:MAG: NUDIX domain-containing protein [Patescibacteria group bacterium]